MCGFWAILFHKLRREKGTADRQNSRIVGQVILGILKCTFGDSLHPWNTQYKKCSAFSVYLH